MKATIRIDMPDSCMNCPLTLHTTTYISRTTTAPNNDALRCLVLGRNVNATFSYMRDADCPLVEVDNDT